MATRYWVGGDGSWTPTNTANWSETSGGAGGASVPTIYDDVVFDNLSVISGDNVLGITFISDVSCKNLTINNSSSGASFVSLQNSNNIITVAGNLSLSGVGNAINGKVRLFGNYTNNTSTNGLGANNIECVRGDSTIQYITSSSPNNNFFNLTIVNSNVVLQISVSNPQLRSLNFTSTEPRTLTVPNNISFTGNVTTSSNTTVSGNVKLAPTSSGKIVYDIGGVFNNLDIATTYSGQTFAFKGTGTILNLTESVSIPFTLEFDTASNLKVQNWGITGISGASVTVKSNIDGTRAKLTKIGGGVVSTNYMIVKDMQPYPDDTWISYNSTNSGNNYQWYFDSFKKPTSSLFFGSHA